jgi:hypothetical protein
MQITSSTAATANMSILKSANEQPHLAGELISKTVEGLMRAQAMQTPVSSPAPLAASGKGTIVNITA